MADPFSIIVGTASLADLCIRFTKLLKNAKDGYQKVDRDLEDLSKEIAALSSVNDLIKRSFEVNLAGITDVNEQQILSKHWQATRTTLAGCRDILERLSNLIIKIVGKGSPKSIQFDGLRKYLKQQSKEDEFIELRRKLNGYQIALQTSLAAVNM